MSLMLWLNLLAIFAQLVALCYLLRFRRVLTRWLKEMEHIERELDSLRCLFNTEITAMKNEQWIIAMNMRKRMN